MWHISEDLKYFKRTTLGCPVIMGYRTFLSLGSRPLPGRLNIVISTHPVENVPDGIVLAESLAEAYHRAENSGAQKCFVIGGGKTYRQAMPGSDLLYITHIHACAGDADTFFPEIDPALWRLLSMEPHRDPATGLDYDFAVYRRLQG